MSIHSPLPKPPAGSTRTARRNPAAAECKSKEERGHDEFSVVEEMPMPIGRRRKRLSHIQIGRIIAEAARVGMQIAEIEIDVGGTTRFRFSGAADSGPDLFEEWEPRL